MVGGRERRPQFEREGRKCGKSGGDAPRGRGKVVEKDGESDKAKKIMRAHSRWSERNQTKRKPAECRRPQCVPVQDKLKTAPPAGFQRNPYRGKKKGNGGKKKEREEEENVEEW